MDVSVRAVLTGFPEAQQQVRSLDRNLQDLGTGTRQVDNSVRSMSAANDMAAKSFSALRASVAGLVGIAGLTALTRGLFDAGTQMERLRVSMAAAAGSAREGAQNFDFTRRLSDALGISFTATAFAFQKFSAATERTSLEGAKTREIFTSMAGAARVLGLTADETAGMFKALEQMVSKGKVSTEELRQQLGERLPGAFRLAAEAMGMTTAQLDKALALGTITAEELLPRLAARVKEVYGDAIPEAAKMAQAELERVRNEWLLMQGAFASSSGFMAAAAASLRGVADAIRGLGRAMDDNESKIDRLRAALPFAPLGLGNLLRPFLPAETPLLQKQSVIDSELDRLIGRAPAPSAGIAPDTVEMFGFNANDPKTAKHFDEILKENEKRRKKEVTAAKKAADEIADHQIELYEFDLRKQEEVDKLTLKFHRDREAREEKERLAQSRGWVEMIDQVNDVIFTWDKFGNRVTLTREEFQALQEDARKTAAEMRAIFGEDTFGTRGVMQGAHESLTNSIAETIKGHESLKGILGKVWQSIVDGIVKELSRIASKTILEPIFKPMEEFFKGLFKDIVQDMKGIFSGAWEWIKAGFLRLMEIIRGSSSSGLGSVAQSLLGGGLGGGGGILGSVLGGGGGIGSSIGGVLSGGLAAAGPLAIAGIGLATVSKALSFDDGLSTSMEQWRATNEWMKKITANQVHMDAFPTGTRDSVYTSPSLIMVGDAGPEMVTVSPMGGAAHGRGMGGGNIVIQGPVIMDAYTQKRFKREMGRM